MIDKQTKPAHIPAGLKNINTQMGEHHSIALTDTEKADRLTQAVVLSPEERRTRNELVGAEYRLGIIKTKVKDLKEEHAAIQRDQSAKLEEAEEGRGEIYCDVDEWADLDSRKVYRVARADGGKFLREPRLIGERLMTDKEFEHHAQTELPGIESPDNVTAIGGGE